MFYLLIGIVAAPALSTIVTAIGTFLTHLIFHVIVFDDSDTTHAFDQILQRLGAVGPRKPDGKIAKGWHRVWVPGTGRLPRGWILAEKTLQHVDRGGVRVTYNVYCLGRTAYCSICDELNKDTNRVITIFEEALVPWRTTGYSYNDARELKAYPRQAEIICQVVQRYMEKKVAMFLVSGDPGQGKTTLGELVGRQLQQKTQMTIIKTAVNLAAPGKGILDSFLERDKDTILILELNEYDIAIKTATGEHEYTNKEISCYAQNKTSLNNLFDFFGQQERLVVIATTNDCTLQDIPEYRSFIRRFDKVIAY